ncbi:MAG: RNA methyltransferase [Thermoplasmata archaeon YP2-bin.285]|uniref:RNA methyltransferase n=1 Tax=Candidatus Sysuiplasma superficiale TaxID=2823368 RepID=A0A8J8CCL2_9ARCH|nr:RNA methyltransferase [Candidatus Sysuiplasma superficiale]
MPEFRVILVRPENEGNIGAVARSMANFDFSELYLVSPVPVGDEARRRAKHGNFILDSSVSAGNVRDAVAGCDIVVGTTGIRNTGQRRFLRNFDTPREFAERVRRTRRKYALLFGPEGLGLSNPELQVCDMIVSIPTSERYPVMNLSHAVSVVLYELFLSGYEPVSLKRALSDEKEKVNEYFSSLLDAIDYPEHKREKARLMFRRLIGRANLSKWEFFITMGVLSRTLKTLSGRKQ